jgi:hypothetical protein
VGTHQDLIAKIQKLRRLSTSNNVHEAAAAAAAADKLIQEHGLEEAQLQADGESGERPSEDEQPFGDWHGRTPQWQLRLAIGLLRHYDCASYRNNTWSSGRTTLHVIGRPSDVASARYMYLWLSLEVERLAQGERGNGRSYINSFRHGAVQGVLNAMYVSKRDARHAAETENKVSSTALVLIDSRADEAKRALETKHLDLRTGRSIGGANNFDGFRAGERAGRNLHRDHAAIGSGGTRSLGSGK